MNQFQANEPAIRHRRIRQTICRWCHAAVPLEKLCQIAARLGYGGIDIAAPETFPTLKKYNLAGTMTPSHTIEKGLNREENWDECLHSIRQSIAATSAAGFTNVICFSGNRNGMDLGEGQKNCATAIKEVIGLAEKSKITLHMELLNSKVDHPDYMADHAEWAVGLVKAVGSEHFKLLYDIYHMQIMEGDVIATIKKYHPYIGHYHTGGVPGRHEIDDSQELNYPAIIRAIVDTGFQGWLGQEFVPVGDSEESLLQAAKICDV